MSAQPYRSSPVFDEKTLPQKLRAHHSTKAGVWGVIRVIEGRLCLTIVDPPGAQMLGPGDAAVILPEQVHFVTPEGPMKMRVDFHEAPPAI